MSPLKSHRVAARRLLQALLLPVVWGCGPGAFAADSADADRAAPWRNDAHAHEQGEAQARDVVRAVALYCQSARQGEVAAQYALGWMLAHGRGMPRDDAAAAHFFAAAAAQGDARSQRMLQQVGPLADQVPACLRPIEPEPVAAAPVLAQAQAQAVPEPPRPPLREVPPQAPKPLVDLVHKLAPQFKLDPILVLAVMAVESNFDPLAVSAKNAQGLMQLIPDTAARFNVRDVFDPAQNIRGGMAYLRWLLAYFEGDVSMVVAAYNAGEGTVERYKGVPPFAETRAYVDRIRRFIGDLTLPYDARATRPSPYLRPLPARKG